MTRLATDYAGDIVSSSKAALLELALTLRAYDEALTLVGGWVPFFLLESGETRPDGFRHVGSIDIDFVVDPDRVSAQEYATIVELLTQRGWIASERSLFTFGRRFKANASGATHEITVDFLTSEPEALAGRRRHREVQTDLKARTMRGAPLALAHRIRHRISGNLPEGGDASAKILMADLVGCIGMKGLALGSRYSEKDAYDLWAVVNYFGKGPADVAMRMKPFRDESLIVEAFASIREKFSRAADAGPVWVANFLGAGDPDGRKALAERAFLVVDQFMEEVGR